MGDWQTGHFLKEWWSSCVGYGTWQIQNWPVPYSGNFKLMQSLDLPTITTKRKDMPPEQQYQKVRLSKHWHRSKIINYQSSWHAKMFKPKASCHGRLEDNSSELMQTLLTKKSVYGFLQFASVCWSYPHSAYCRTILYNSTFPQAVSAPIRIKLSARPYSHGVGRGRLQ